MEFSYENMKLSLVVQGAVQETKAGIEGMLIHRYYIVIKGDNKN